jgi:hypothetical protein
MGVIRNGARSHLDLFAKMLKLSHMRGFAAGVSTILGPLNADEYLSGWVNFKQAAEALVEADNYWNRIDTVPEVEGDEDVDLSS